MRSSPTLARTLLSCLLTLDRMFALDREDGSLDLLATAPIPLEGIAASKALAHWLTTGLPLTLAAPVFAIAHIATTDSIVREMPSATNFSGAAPRSRSTRASRFSKAGRSRALTSITVKRPDALLSK